MLRVGGQPVDQSVRAKRVLNGKPLTEKFRIPHQAHARTPQVQGFGDAARRTHRNRRFSHHQVTRAQMGQQCVHGCMDMAEIGAVFVAFLRCTHCNEMHGGASGRGNVGRITKPARCCLLS